MKNKNCDKVVVYMQDPHTYRVVIWLDWATTRFRFIGPNSGYTGGFCVFGPVLSSPASCLTLPGYASNLNRNILDFMRWPQIDLGAQDINDIQRPKAFQNNSWK
jgi:hypothetical protein